MAAGGRGSALTELFKIDAEYAVKSEKHYTFCFLADPFVDGPARSDFWSKKLSATKRVFENQYGDEAIPLMCMILLDCGDSNSSDRLAKYAPSPFAGWKVKEEKRIAYNLRCLFVSIASKLDSESRENMVKLLQEELDNRESVGTKYQTVLLLLEKAHQAGVISPQELTQLEEWLGFVERDDLIKLYFEQFDPNKQFPGHEQMQEASSPPPAVERQCNKTTGQKYSRSRSSSHGYRPTLASYGSSDQYSKFRSDSIASYGSSDQSSKFQSDDSEDKGPRDVADMVSGLKLEQVQPHFSAHATSILSMDPPSSVQLMNRQGQFSTPRSAMTTKQATTSYTISEPTKDVIVSDFSVKNVVYENLNLLVTPQGNPMASKIPFIIPPQLLEFNSTGADFVGFDEIRIQIPPHAIPEGSTRQLKIGVCLYGPFLFEENYRPISPILWLCLQGGNTHLDKPVNVTLPHILPDLSKEERAYFRVRFAKANHDCVTDASGEWVYKFQPSLDKPFYFSGGGKGYGTLQTDHFCFMCLVAENKITDGEAKRVGYCLTSVQGPSRLHVYASYFLETCIAALEKQMDKDDRKLTSGRFTLRQGCDHIIVSCNPREAVNMIPSNGKIRVTNIDFWGSGKSYEEMKLEHDQKMYPPKVVISTTDLSSMQKITVMFSNLKEGDDLDIDVTLCQDAGIMEWPSADVSFTRQEGDKSDFKMTKAKANYSAHVPLRWNLEGAHQKGVDGEGITIAVLDSGVNRNHDAFAKTILSGRNFIDGKGHDYWCSNREAHGSMVTGIITKYAPKAEIYVCCVSEENRFKPKAIIRALEHLQKSYEDEHISDKKKCQVIVMSFGHYNREEYPERKKLISDLACKGVICVAAIGNYGLYADQLAYPALLDEVIAVGGLTEFGHEPATFNPPGKIDVYAPGEAICFPADTSNRKYRKGGGTSCAAPAIGGIVALLMQLARKSDDKINNTKAIKMIFSHMKRKVTEKKIEVLDPKYFFDEYGTPDKFKIFLQKYN